MSSTREILFRGKRADGSWVTGYYFAKPVICQHYIINGENQWAVDPATVGQYTGLKDANGMEIFEGDIVLDEESGYRYQLKWFQDYGCFAYANSAGHMEFEYADVFLDCMKVIGNIHDNLELLATGSMTPHSKGDI